jgi:hypothetical protein
MLPADQQLIAVQKPAIVVIETEPMTAGQRHFSSGRREKKQVSMFDDDRFGDTVGHGRSSLRQNVCLFASSPSRIGGVRQPPIHESLLTYSTRKLYAHSALTPLL